MPRPFLLPEFKSSPFEGYAIRYINTNLWRFAATVSTWEDALSEAVVVYYRCRRKYGASVENRAHFMALYKQVLFTHFTDLANRETKYGKIYGAGVDVSAGWYLANPSMQTVGFEGELSVKLLKASPELKRVLAAIMHSATLDEQNPPRNYFKHVVVQCGIQEKRTPKLEKELRALLA